jgi:hypothetical protein
MTWLPHGPGWTLILRLNQETVHDYILSFLPPCNPHLTPLSTGSLERSLLLFFTPGGLTGNNLSHFFFTCTNTSQTATCTRNYEVLFVFISLMKSLPMVARTEVLQKNIPED